MWSSTFVDEVGYLTYETDAADLLFHVVNDRHRRKRSMIFTTNKATTAWGKVLHDEDLAQAIVDRVLERGRLLTLGGPSMRTKHLRLDESAPAGASTHGVSDGARISEFLCQIFRNLHILDELRFARVDSHYVDYLHRKLCPFLQTEILLSSPAWARASRENLRLVATQLKLNW